MADAGPKPAAARIEKHRLEPVRRFKRDPELIPQREGGGRLQEIAPRVPAELESIVVRCTAKDPSARFQSMGLLRRALVNLGQPTARPAKAASIAVLPFTNLSADKEDEYFSDGLTRRSRSRTPAVPATRTGC